MPVDLNRLTEGWLELESDPGLFTLLLEDFGVKGVQVDEVYDLQKPIEGPVFGFIFLFKWIEERRARRKTAEEEKFVEEESIVNSIFFAQQVIPNSCATHALLSVLLNCTKVNLGPNLTQFKEHTKNMNPENKGYAIGNSPELARAHNSHAKPQPRSRVEKPHGIGSGGRTKEAFHFVSYVPINGRLYELDGLKPYPIDHGPQGDDWTEKFRSVITDRLGSVTQPSHDIRFSLMAVVPDRRTSFHQKLRILKTNRQIVLEALQQLVKMTHPELISADPDSFLAAVSSQDIKGFSSGHRTPPPPHLYPKLPPALDSHNYAKSPLMENYPASMNSSAINPPFDHTEDMEEENAHESTPPHRPLRINTEFLKPLSIQTKFQQPSPTASTSSTDTSSEAGSAFNSPVSSGGGNIVSPGGIGKSAATTPTSTPQKKGNLDQDILDNVKSVNKLVVVRMTKQESNPCPPSPQAFKGNVRDGDQPFDHSSSSEDHGKFNSRLMEPHHFAPKDLLALLKTVESEIATCEANLKDEIEKRKKYKIDDCRRTHNYDQFVCTFLSMLAEQGKLSDLVEMQLSSKSSQQRHPPAAVVAAPPRLRPKKTPERRRKAKPRKKR